MSIYKTSLCGSNHCCSIYCKEKVDQEKRSDEDIAKGIVKFLVDVYDETGETVAIATIFALVKKLDQSK